MGKIVGNLLSVNDDGTIELEDPLAKKHYKFKIKPKYVAPARKLVGQSVVVTIIGGKVKKLSRTVKLRVYGVPYKKFKEIAGEAKKKYGALSSIMGLDFGLESIFDVITILIWLVLFIFALAYYVIVLPIIYFIASIFTLGEVWKMRYKYTVVLPADRLLKLNAETLAKKKVYIKGLPENMLTTEFRKMFSKLGKPYALFDFGRVLIALSLVIALGLYVYYWYFGISGGFINFARTSGYWIYPVGVFTIGFLSIIIAGIWRGLIKINL